MKDFNIQNITRENVKKMSPYSSARDEFKDFTHTMVYLDANENPFQNGMNRYPDPQQKKLKAILSKQNKIPENQINKIKLNRNNNSRTKLSKMRKILKYVQQHKPIRKEH